MKLVFHSSAIAISMFNNTALRPGDRYSFTDADIAPSVVTDLCEGK